jgi:XTP/dITP diphosphohydrolase
MNAHKVRELSLLLAPFGVPLTPLNEFPRVVPAVEDGTTLAENARRKAAGYALQLGEWVLADDTGLEVDALAGAPGVRSARYAGDRADMAANRAKLLAELASAPEAARSGRFVCWLAVAAPWGEVVEEATGVCCGVVRREPAGTGGFGYDALFEVTGTGRTLAELNAAETAALGHRGQAARALMRRLLGD